VWNCSATAPRFSYLFISFVELRGPSHRTRSPLGHVRSHVSHASDRSRQQPGRLYFTDCDLYRYCMYTGIMTTAAEPRTRASPDDNPHHHHYHYHYVYYTTTTCVVCGSSGSAALPANRSFHSAARRVCRAAMPQGGKSAALCSGRRSCDRSTQPGPQGLQFVTGFVPLAVERSAFTQWRRRSS
jgi:hypothetical protein